MTIESIPIVVSEPQSGDTEHAHRQNCVNCLPDRMISSAAVHELNNMLTIIQGYSERLLIKNGQNPEVRKQLSLISNACMRAAAIIHDCVFYKPGAAPNPQPPCKLPAEE
jgi:hypothetical protein